MSETFVIDVFEKNGDKNLVDSNVVCSSLQEVIEHVLSVLSDCVDDAAIDTPVRMDWTDEDKEREEYVRHTVGVWRGGGWFGDTELIFPGAIRMTIKRPVSTPTNDEDIDALIVNALDSVRWVIDDLRSWESNPESAKYNADKLADAVTVIRARTKSLTGGTA